MRFSLAVAVLLSAASCKDEGIERHRKALEQYSGCVGRMLPPTDPCFDAVLTTLDGIPKGSPARAHGDELRAALTAARHPKVAAPLSVPGCEELAQQVGTAAPAERAEKLRALQECRVRAEKHDEDHAP